VYEARRRSRGSQTRYAAAWSDAAARATLDGVHTARREGGELIQVYVLRLFREDSGVEAFIARFGASVSTTVGGTEI
jgi:hypothetical protein